MIKRIALCVGIICVQVMYAAEEAVECLSEASQETSARSSLSGELSDDIVEEDIDTLSDSSDEEDTVLKASQLTWSQQQEIERLRAQLDHMHIVCAYEDLVLTAKTIHVDRLEGERSLAITSGKPYLAKVYAEYIFKAKDGDGIGKLFDDHG